MRKDEEMMRRYDEVMVKKPFVNPWLRKFAIFEDR